MSNSHPKEYDEYIKMLNTGYTCSISEDQQRASITFIRNAFERHIEAHKKAIVEEQYERAMSVVKS